MTSLINDKEFVKTIDSREKTACLTLVAFLKNFLRNKKVKNFADLVVRMLKGFVILDAK